MCVGGLVCQVTVDADDTIGAVWMDTTAAAGMVLYGRSGGGCDDGCCGVWWCGMMRVCCWRVMYAFALCLCVVVADVVCVGGTM